MNNQYSKYDPVTGQITQVGTCNDLKLSTLSNYVLGIYDGTLYEIVDGAPVLKAQSVLDAQQLVIDTSNAINKRNALLAASDKYVLPDFPTSLGSEWLTYRQDLRDLPSDPNWPDVTFPTPPE